MLPIMVAENKYAPGAESDSECGKSVHLKLATSLWPRSACAVRS